MRVLIALAEKWLPEFSDTKKIDITKHLEDGYIVDMTGHSIPCSHAIIIDRTKLNQQQFTQIRNIALELEAKHDQEQRIVDAD